MAASTLTSKGQTTIPREVREFLKLKTGDRMEFKLNPDERSVTLHAVNVHISELRGMLRGKGSKSYRPDERKVAIRKRAASH